MKVLGLLTARGGSKGVPGKNIRPLAGKPLLQYSVEAAQRSGCLDRLILSSDDPQILEVGRNLGVETPFVRPAELADDHSDHISVVLHALEQLASPPDYVLLLQPTSPFRTGEDIRGCVSLALARQASGVVSVSEVVDHPVLMKTMDERGALQAYASSNLAYARRQDLPRLYIPNGALYCTSVRALREERTFYPKGVLGFLMPEERSLQIDTPWQFHVAELIMACLHRRDEAIGGEGPSNEAGERAGHAQGI